MNSMKKVARVVGPLVAILIYWIDISKILNSVNHVGCRFLDGVMVDCGVRATGFALV